MLAPTNRKHKRTRVLLKAIVRSGDWDVDVRIRDLSTKGALLEGAARPATGKEVRLIRGALDEACTVTWVDAERFGVEFAQPITEATVFEHIGTPLRVSAPASYRRPGLAESALRKGELKLVEAWVANPARDPLGE